MLTFNIEPEDSGDPDCGLVLDVEAPHDFAGRVTVCSLHLSHEEAIQLHGDLGAYLYESAPATATRDPEQALMAIWRILDGREWEAEDLEHIAAVLKDAGYTIREANDYRDEACNCGIEPGERMTVGHHHHSDCPRYHL